MSIDMYSEAVLPSLDIQGFLIISLCGIKE